MKSAVFFVRNNKQYRLHMENNVLNVNKFYLSNGRLNISNLICGICFIIGHRN